MSSSNKSEFLGLNIWSGSDIPKMADFNYDNSTVDAAMKNHCNDTDIHISDEERAKWNSPYYMNVYFGDSGANRTIETGCPFAPSFGIIFANVTAPSTANFASKMHTHFSAFVSKRANTLGANLSGTTLTVKQSTAAVTGSEYASLNASGYTYCYILFR